MILSFNSSTFMRKDVQQWEKHVLEYDWVKFVNNRDKPWVMIPKCRFEQCWDKVDKMRKTSNKYQ